MHGVAIEAETEHGERLVRVWRSDGPLTPSAMADRVRWQIDGWLNTSWADRPSGGISVVQLLPEEVVADDGRQLGFWGGSSAADDRAARAFARLQGLFGPDAVHVATIVGGRGPRESITTVRWGDERPKPLDGIPWPGTLPAPAPATVWPAPVAAEVVDDAGRSVVVGGRLGLSSPPARVDGVAVEGWAGPWPVDERWWDPSARRRRVRFQVALANGAAHLLMLESGQWSIEASYD